MHEEGQKHLAVRILADNHAYQLQVGAVRTRSLSASEDNVLMAMGFKRKQREGSRGADFSNLTLSATSQNSGLQTWVMLAETKPQT